jgi:hypothetical protein
MKPCKNEKESILERFLMRKGIFAVDWVSRFLSPTLAPIVTYMAKTEMGTDRCLRLGALPIQVHFHSPVLDLADLEQRQVWNVRSTLEGISFREESQIEFLLKLGQHFGSECHWPSGPQPDSDQFYTENGTFSYGCAAISHCILRHFKPHHVIEIGAGNSSLVLSKALCMNAKESKEKIEYIAVDPYPGSIVENGLPGLTEIIREPVERLPTNFFDRLGRNDVLFIDSGHTVRIGGDVNFLILDVLPRLAPGVIVHFHDIGLPYEYPKVYSTNPKFRVFWTEAYLLQAFLCFNSQFEVLLAMSYLMTEHLDAFREVFPLYDPLRHRAASGSFWIRRKK